MGTRGLVGYYKKGVTKASYNHYDSYPQFLGDKIKEYTGDADALKLNRDFDGIKFVEEDTDVTAEMVMSVFNFWYGDVDKIFYGGRNGDTYNMYDLLTRSHTDIAWLAHCGLMIDYIDFIKSSLFCEWAYLINLDRGVLEIYRGWQGKKPAKNRYALTKEELAELKAEKGYNTVDGKRKRKHVRNQYYNCALIAQIPLEDVKYFDMELFQDMVKRSEDMTGKSCGNVLVKDVDFTWSAVRSTILQMTLSVFGLGNFQGFPDEE
jgi:hypothetical protein